MRRYYLLALMILAACGAKERDAQSNRVSPAEPQMPTETATNSEPAPAEPPADFKMPDFAPQYPGSSLVAVSSAQLGRNQNHEVRLTTTDDAAKIMDFYRERFSAAGLRKTSDFLSGGSGMMSGIGKDRKASIAITKEQDHQMVIVTYSGQ